MLHHVIESTPTVDTSAYASGDHLGTLMTLEGVCEGGAAGCVLRGVAVADKAKQSAAIKLLIFDESPTIASSDNAAVDVSDAELVDKAIAAVSIAAGDYVALNANSLAHTSCEIHCKPKAGAKLYVLAVSAGTPTYTAAGDLTFKFHFTY